MSEIEFDMHGGSGSVTLAPSQTAELRFVENPTTGFRWEPVDVPGGVAVEDVAYRQAPDSGIGAGGRRVFRISGAPGTYRVQFVLRRSWEADQPPRAITEVTLVVR